MKFDGGGQYNNRAGESGPISLSGVSIDGDSSKKFERIVFSGCTSD